jgi:4-cresol dehydrogenase (hydroxylating)
MVPRFFELHRGIPNESVVRRAYFYDEKARPEKDVDIARDDIGLMWFVPLLPFRGEEITKYLNECSGVFRHHGFDPAMSITPVNPRTVVTLMIILYRRNDSESCERAGALYDELQTKALEKGYQQFRCGHPGWDRLFDLNPELKQFHETLKRALDPKGILAPGRYGIGADA